MKRNLKITLMTAILLCTALLLFGCDERINFTFDYTGTYLDDKYIDLLVPIEPGDELFTEYNERAFANFRTDDKPVEISPNSEIVGYKDDGFRSVAFHLEKTEIVHRTGDDCNWRNIILPYQFSSRKGLNGFCNRYKVGKLAVCDLNGNIITISEEFPLMAHKEFYINPKNMRFDPQKNTLDPGYLMPSGEESFIIFLDVLWTIGLAYMAVVVIAWATRKNKSDTDMMPYTVVAALLTLPSILLIFMQLRFEIYIHPDIFQALGYFVKHNGIPKIIGLMIPTGVLTTFCLMAKPFTNRPSKADVVAEDENKI